MIQSDPSITVTRKVIVLKLRALSQAENAFVCLFKMKSN